MDDGEDDKGEDDSDDDEGSDGREDILFVPRCNIGWLWR